MSTSENTPLDVFITKLKALNDTLPDYQTLDDNDKSRFNNILIDQLNTAMSILKSEEPALRETSHPEEEEMELNRNYFPVEIPAKR